MSRVGIESEGGERFLHQLDVVTGLVEIVFPLISKVVVAGAAQRGLVHLNASELSLVGLEEQIVYLFLIDGHAVLLYLRWIFLRWSLFDVTNGYPGIRALTQESVHPP